MTATQTWQDKCNPCYTGTRANLLRGVTKVGDHTMTTLTELDIWISNIQTDGLLPKRRPGRNVRPLLLLNTFPVADRGVNFIHILRVH